MSTNATVATATIASCEAGGEAQADTLLTILAIFSTVLSSLFTTFGLFFQKITQIRMQVPPEDIPGDPKAFQRRTIATWLAGFCSITFFSFGLDLFSMSTLGQALVVPLLASLEVAENQLLAPYMLGEVMDKLHDISASVVVVIGATITTIWGPKGPWTPDQTMDYEETKAYFGELFSAPAFIVFEVITVSLLVFCFVCMKRKPLRMKHLMFLCYGYAAGFLGGEQNLFLKGLGTFLGTAFAGNGGPVFGDWMVYVFIIFMASLAGAQLHFLNEGLALFPALTFVPTYTVLYICSGTAVGLVFYQEYKQLTGVDAAMFGMGFFFIIVALGILAHKKEPEGVAAEEPLPLPGHKAVDQEAPRVDSKRRPSLNPNDIIRNVSANDLMKAGTALCGGGAASGSQMLLRKPTMNNLEALHLTHGDSFNKRRHSLTSTSGAGGGNGQAKANDPKACGGPKPLPSLRPDGEQGQSVAKEEQPGKEISKVGSLDNKILSC